MRARSHAWRTGARVLALAALLGALAIGTTLGWLKWHESELVFQTRVSHARADAPLPPPALRLAIALPDGTALAAIVVPAAAAVDSGYWVLHLHGNADSAFSRTQLRHCEQLRAVGFSVLAFDYRGFGQSPGIATESGMNEDAQAAYETLVRRGVPPERIIIWGHSLGSAPAVALATHEPAAALVLFGAFTSIADMAAATYPYLPVRWIVGIQMNSLHRIGAVHVPVLIAHSLTDGVVPFRLGTRLFAAANQPKRFLALLEPTADRFGGHVNALYDQAALLRRQLEALLRSAPLPLKPGS